MEHKEETDRLVEETLYIYILKICQYSGDKVAVIQYEDGNQVPWCINSNA